MKITLAILGHLAAFRQLSRDHLAEGIGTTRQNLISAFKGRRPLPTAQMPPLRRALGLDEDYRFEPGRVHVLTANQGEKQRALLLHVLRRCMSPIRSKWLLRGIGEGRNGFGYVFEDDRGVLVAVRNDDTLLGISSETWKGAGDAAILTGRVVDKHMDMDGLFLRSDGSPEREIALASFNALFSEGMRAEDLRATLNSTATVWTWARLREKAEQTGKTAEIAAQALGFAGSLSE
jgi:hypothetical protein